MPVDNRAGDIEPDGITRCWVKVIEERDTARKERDALITSKNACEQHMNQWRDLASTYLCALQKLTSEMECLKNERDEARENATALKERFDREAHGTT